MGEPVPAPTVTVVNCGETSFDDESVGDACLCDVGGGASVTAHGDAAFQACTVRGHAGACVFEADEFAGCTNGDNASCEPTCALIGERLAADAATTFAVELASAQCTDVGPALPGQEPSRTCDCIFQLDDECFESPQGDRVPCPGF